MILAVAAALAVYTAYMFFYNSYLAPKPHPPEPPAEATDHVAPPDTPTPGTLPTEAAATGPAQSAPTAQADTDLRIVGGEAVEPVVIGGGDLPFRLTLDPRGASVRTLEITAKKKSGRLRHRKQIESDEPYVLIDADIAGAGLLQPLGTRRIWVDPLGGDKAWRLDGVAWRLVERSARRAVFEVVLFDGATERNLIHVRKTYEIAADRSLVYVRLDATNSAGQAVAIGYEQIGPCGVLRESTM